MVMLAHVCSALVTTMAMDVKLNKQFVMVSPFALDAVMAVVWTAVRDAQNWILLMVMLGAAIDKTVAVVELSVTGTL